jgi:hypothetical protein
MLDNGARVQLLFEDKAEAADALKIIDRRLVLDPKKSHTPPQSIMPWSGIVHPSPILLPPVVLAHSQHQSTVKTTRKLTLSDYKAARMKRVDISASGK